MDERKFDPMAEVCARLAWTALFKKAELRTTPEREALRNILGERERERESEWIVR
jgi:hypothetical protein